MRMGCVIINYVFTISEERREFKNNVYFYYIIELVCRYSNILLTTNLLFVGSNPIL